MDLGYGYGYGYDEHCGRRFRVQVLGFAFSV